MDANQRQGFEKKLERDLSPLILEPLSDDSVVEIYVNSDQNTFVEKLGEAPKCIGKLTTDTIRAIIGDVAHFAGTTANRENPVIEGTLPEKFFSARFAGTIEPVSPPSFNIRKPAKKIYTLDDYIASGALNDQQRKKLDGYIRARKNILIGGSTGSGKTTFVNALLHEMSLVVPEDRLVIIEDSDEIRCFSSDYQKLLATSACDHLQCLKTTLRRRPSRIVLGEVRGAEALELLRIWHSGHPGGICTVHCDNAAMALEKMELAILEVTESPMQRFIASAVDVIIFMERAEKAPVLKEIVEVQQYDAVEKKYLIDPIYFREVKQTKTGA